MRQKFASVLLALVFALGAVTTSGIPVSAAESGLTVHTLTVNDSASPLGLDLDSIRFGWKLKSDGKNKAQSAYRIVVREGASTVWDSGKVESNLQYGVPYGGSALKERTRYDWSVSVWDEQGTESPAVSDYFETGIEDWTGIEWLGGEDVKLLKNVWQLSQPASEIARAHAYICGEGMYELHINGRTVGGYVLTPPPSQYYARAYYITYDIAEYLKDGQNVFGIMLGYGKKGKYFDNLRLARMLVEVSYRNGRTDKLLTDGQSGWAMSTDSPVTRDTYFYGEDQDTTLYEGWDSEPVISLSDDIWAEGSFDGSRVVDETEGTLVVHSNVGQQLYLQDTYDDFVLEATIMLEDTGNPDPAVGIIFGGQNDANLYMWQINFTYDRIRPHKLINGAWSVVNETGMNKAAVVGKYFDLKLEVNGGVIRTYLDGVLLNTVSDSTFASGRIGFRFAGGLGDPTRGETLHLDKLKITAGSGETLLNENFDSAPQSWTEAAVFGGNVYVEDGALNLRGSNAFTRASYSDFTLEADVTVLNSGVEKTFGLYFRKGEGNNAYMWQVNLSLMTLRAHVLQEGVWDVPETQALPSDMAVGKPFRFKLEARGSRFRTWIDDVLISDFTDDTFAEGRIGFRLEAGEYNWIDNVRITDADGGVLLEDDFSTLDDLASGSWIFPTRFAPEMMGQNSFTVVNEVYRPQTIQRPSAKKYVIDFGQNMSGWVRLKVRGERGATVKISYAEHLSADGTDINGDTLSGHIIESGSYVYNTYVLNGEEQVLQPKFNYTGFRYVSIEVSDGVPELTEDNIEACYVTEKMDIIGDFQCSDEIINGVMKIYMESQKSNDVGLFLASPHREKDGWLGDAHVVSKAVNYIFDSARLYEKFFLDMDDNTYEGDLTYPDGLIRVFVPHVPTGDHSLADPPWQSGRFIIMWDYYQTTGDLSIVQRSYHKMKLTMEYFQSLQLSETNYRIDANAFGDWLGFDNRNGMVSKEFLSTAYYYHSAVLFARMAALCGEDADARTYERLAENIKSAINRDWLKGNSYYDKNTQSSNSIALAFGLVPDAARENVIQNLVRNVEECGYVLKTGVLGLKTIFTSLNEVGRSDILLKLASQTKYPSLGYMYENGATTLWEYWEPYGYAMQFGPNYQSLNHNMYGGGYAAWCYEGLAGIVNEGIAYDKVRIQPANNIGTFSAAASTDTVRGVVSSSWQNRAGSYSLSVEIPVGAQATVCIPDQGRTNVTIRESGAAIYADGRGSDSQNVSFVEYRDGYFVYTCGSGRYSFELTGTDPAVQPETPFDTSAYKAKGNSFDESVSITEVTGRVNPWKIDGDGTLSIDRTDIEYMAKFGGIYLRGDDFVYSGTLNFSQLGVDFWDGARFVIGYDRPTEFEIIDFQKGGVFYSRRTESESTGWHHFISVPYLLKNDKDYNFKIKVISGRLYVSLNGERLIDGYLMEQDRPEKAFGVFNSKSAFSVKELTISEIAKESGTDPDPEPQPDPKPSGCFASCGGCGNKASLLLLPMLVVLGLIRRRR